jgi:hypothetical protein
VADVRAPLLFLRHMLFHLLPSHRRVFTRKQRSYLEMSKLFIFTNRDLAASCLVVALDSIPPTEAVIGGAIRRELDLDFIAAPILI